MSADTKNRGSATCGRLRIYLSFAPGAGATCALLSEGHRRAEHGTDVAVASAETHGRPYTAGLLDGLEVISPTKVPYRETVVEEMNLGAVLARPAAAHRAALAAQRQLTVSLGGSYHQLADQDIPAALLAFARANNATQLVLGTTRHTSQAGLRPASAISSRVIRRGGGIDVYIVTCPPTPAAWRPQHGIHIRARARQGEQRWSRTLGPAACGERRAEAAGGQPWMGEGISTEPAGCQLA